MRFVWIFFALLATGNCLFSQAPIAGLSVDSLFTASNLGNWRVYIRNSSTGSPTNWSYWVTSTSCPTPFCPTYGGYTTTNPHAGTMVLVQPPAWPVFRFWQIVSNAWGADTTYVDATIDCSQLSGGIVLQTHFDTSSHPQITVTASSNIDHQMVETSIYGDGLVTPQRHSFFGYVIDTLLLPGPVRACGHFYNSNCYIQRLKCDTINIPCWRPPFVDLQHVSSGLQAVFTDSVIATDGASWLWEFGDGDTSHSATTTMSHTYANPGTYNACLTVIDTCGTTTICANVQVLGTGLNDLYSIKINLSPNPSDGKFLVSGKAISGSQVAYQILDMHAHVLATGILPLNGADLHEELAVGLAQGIYFIRFHDNLGGSKVLKLVIK
jgi:PKD repeat protein